MEPWIQTGPDLGPVVPGPKCPLRRLARGAIVAVVSFATKGGEMSIVGGSFVETSGYEASDSGEAEAPFVGGGGALAAPPLTLSEAPADAFAAASETETPFLTGESTGDRITELHQLLAELYDSEFDHALQELSDTAAASVASGPMHAGAASPEAESYVRDWLEPLHHEARSMVDAIGETLAEHDLARLSESEIDRLLAPHEPIATGSEPAFENFLGGFFNKIKHVVSGAANLAKKGVVALTKLLPIDKILAGVKSFVRPLLERVLQMALDRLPPALRPAAEALKKHLLGEAELELELEDLEDEWTGAPTPTVAEVSEVQQEFDVNAASLLLAPDQHAQDAVVAEAWDATAQHEDPINDLAAARQRFEAELRALPPGASPQPAIEGFLPVVMGVMPLLKMGISLIGRDRIIKFIAQFVAPLIQPYIGDQAPVLAQAIASTGLSLMSLEVPADPQTAAASALAGTVEDTARRVAEHAGGALDSPELLEATTASAFDEAAAANFPPALIKAGHRPVHLGIRAGHARAHAGHRDGHHPGSGMWVSLPHTHVYRKYTRGLTAHITPTIARQVPVFGGTTLEAFLRDRYGITGDVTVPAHVYEARHGATVGRIAAFETRTKGLGSVRAAWKLQPLTPEVAGLLFGEPGLGKKVTSEPGARPHRLAVGQRLYYLELTGRPAHRDPARPPAAGAPAPTAQPAPSPRGTGVPAAAPAPSASAAPASAAEVNAAPGRSSEVNVRVDVPGRRLRVALYLSESDAQEAAGLIASHGPPAITKLVRERLHAGLKIALSALPQGHLRWNDPAAAAAAAAHPPTEGPQWLADPNRAGRLVHRVLGWTAPAMFDFVARDSAEFIAAVRRRSDGVTLIAELHGVGLGHHHRPGADHSKRMPRHVESAPASRHEHGPAVVEVVPGFRRA